MRRRVQEITSDVKTFLFCQQTFSWQNYVVQTELFLYGKINIQTHTLVLCCYMAYNVAEKKSKLNKTTFTL